MHESANINYISFITRSRFIPHLTHYRQNVFFFKVCNVQGFNCRFVAWIDILVEESLTLRNCKEYASAV